MARDQKAFFWISWIERINIAAGSFAGVCIFLMIITIIPDTLVRKFASEAIQGVSEFNILTMVVLVFLGQASAQCRKENFQVRIVVDQLSPALQRLNNILVFSLQLLVAGVFAWLCTKKAVGSYLGNEMSFAIIAFPIWPARIAVAAGFWLLTLQLIIDIARAALPGRLPPPPATGGTMGEI